MDYLKKEPSKYLMDGNKMLWYGDRIQEFMQGKKVMPITLDMGIHKSCNMQCIFCYGDYQQKSTKYIPTDKLLKIARDCGEAGIKSVAVIGDGEPTMNPGLYDFVDALKENGVAPALATNGLLLDNEKIERLTAKCSWIRFTICAVGEKYRMIHKGVPEGSYERIKGIIKHAVDNKGNCTIGLQQVLVPECFDQIVPLTELAVELGVDYHQIKQFSDAGEGMNMHFDMNEYAKVEEDLKKAEAMGNDKTEVIVKWNGMEESKNVTMNKKWSFDKCIDLPFLMQVSGNGKCYPCGYMFNKEEYCYGDLQTQTLAEILNSDRYWDIIKTIAKIPVCDLCNGQCRHSSNLEFLDKFTKAYPENGHNTKKTLISLCGSEAQYYKLMENPPCHLEFV